MYDILLRQEVIKRDGPLENYFIRVCELDKILVCHNDSLASIWKYGGDQPTCHLKKLALEIS